MADDAVAMAGPATRSQALPLAVHAVGFFLLAGTMAGFTWLQIQLIGPRWESLSLLMALVVALFAIQGARKVREAVRAARQTGG